MKKLLLIMLIFAGIIRVNAQSIGIGTASPNSSAMLDVASTNKGLLIPRMTGSQRNAIASPVNGLIIYQTNTEIFPPSTPGFYLYESGGWKRMARADEIAGGSSTWTVNGANQYSNVSGSVSIGTSAPNASALLDVASTTKGVLFPRMTTSQRFAIANPAAGLVVYDTDKDELHHYNGSSWWAINNGTYWSRPLTGRSRIANTADSVGIGTSSATEKLDVNGNIRVRNNLLADNLVTAAEITSTGNITATGNGSVVGNITSFSDMTINNTSGILQFRSGLSDKGFVQLSGDDIRVGTNSSNTTGKFHIRTGGSNNLTVLNSGFTGIGTETPSAQLQINSGPSNTTLRLQADNLPTLQFYTGATPIASIQPAGNNLRIIAGGDNVVLNDVLYADDASNRVGIGTSTPAQKLHVSGNALVSSMLSVGGILDVIGESYFGDTVTVNRTLRASAIEVRGGIVEGYGALAAGALSGAYGFAGVGLGENASAGSDNSLAFGTDVHASNYGACIIGDGMHMGPPGFTNSVGINTMTMRFDGGYWLYSSADLTNGATLGPGDNSWSVISDSTKKVNFKYADGNVFLEKISRMKLGSWNYRSQDKGKRHYGPMAQEFFSNFGNDGIGKIGCDTAIASADIDGVMMITLQALEKRTADQQAMITELKKELLELKAILQEQKKKGDLIVR